MSASALSEANTEVSGLAVGWPRAWQLALFYLVCLLGAGYAELLATIPGTGISIWLPSGLLLGALLINPRRKLAVCGSPWRRWRS